MLKPWKEERPKTYLTPISLEQSLDVAPRGKGQSLGCQAHEYFFCCLCIYIVEDCVCILYVPLNA